MKPKPFDALNHFTFPVGTRLSWRKIWIECSPEPLLWPGATEDSLVQFAVAALTGAGVCRYTRPVARGTDRIINSPARRSPVLEAVLNGAHRSYVNLAPPMHPSMR